LRVFVLYMSFFSSHVNVIDDRLFQQKTIIQPTSITIWISAFLLKVPTSHEVPPVLLFILPLLKGLVKLLHLIRDEVVGENYICMSFIPQPIYWHDSSTDNIYDELGFDCPRLPNEGKVVYKIRYGHELRFFLIHKNQTRNKTSVCPFHAVAMQNTKENLWRFIVFPDSDLNFKMHSYECLCLPTIKSKALVSAMKPILAGNNSLSGK
jgi:hypothetical protein